MGASNPHQCLSIGAWVCFPCLELKSSTGEAFAATCCCCCRYWCSYWPGVVPGSQRWTEMIHIQLYTGCLPGNYSALSSPWHLTGWRRNRISAAGGCCCLEDFSRPVKGHLEWTVLLPLPLDPDHLLLQLILKIKHGTSCRSGKGPNHLTDKVH